MIQRSSAVNPFILPLAAALFAPLMSSCAYAQGGEPRLYLSEVLEPTVKKKAAYYREPVGRDGELFIGKTFSMEGKLKAEGTYLDEQLQVPHGRFTFFHANGKVESRGQYVQGNKSGVWERYDVWGQALAEKVYNPEPLANIVYTRAQTMPAYPGGDDKALVRYVKEAVMTATDKRVRGTYTSSFIVEKDGSLSDVKVVEGQDEKVGQQVATAIKNTAPWKPGEDKGQPVRVQMRVPVQF
jgi:hypothetical protein